MATSFKELLASGKFLVTVSIDPPKGADLEGVHQFVQGLKGAVDAVGVSDNHNAVMCMSPWAVCQMVLAQDMEPIMHVTCRDRNRLALQSDLLAAASAGIRNILCVSGDHIRFGDHADAMPVHDVDSVHLLTMARALEEGHDMAGNPIEGRPEFFLGAVANAEAEPLEPQLIKLDKKIEAGASFLVTHPVFELENLTKLKSHIWERKVKLLAGIRLLVPEEAPKYEAGSYPGLFVPEHVREEIQGADMDKCIEMAGNMVRDIKAADLCAGVHLTAPGHMDKIQEIMKVAGI